MVTYSRKLFNDCMKKKEKARTKGLEVNVQVIEDLVSLISFKNIMIKSSKKQGQIFALR